MCVIFSIFKENFLFIVLLRDLPFLFVGWFAYLSAGWRKNYWADRLRTQLCDVTWAWHEPVEFCGADAMPAPWSSTFSPRVWWTLFSVGLGGGLRSTRCASSWFVCSLNLLTTARILRKLGGGMGPGSGKNPLNSGANLERGADPGFLYSSLS